MAVVTASSAKQSYDVIIVGSGAAGGQAAYTLTLEGATVLMIEAGRNYDPASAPMLQTPDQAPLRGAATVDKQVGFYDATVNGGDTIPGEPYTQASGESSREFLWWRARMLGGRTNHWTRVAFRYGPYDFKQKSRDGLGCDWPISYEDLAPYYDKVEMLVGIFGTNEGLENTPDSSPGCLLPPPKPLVSDLLFAQRAAPMGIPVIPCHKAILTQRLDSQNLPARLHPGNAFAQRIVRESMESRAACFWATECMRGCAIKANYQSPTVHLPPAMATGNLDLLCNAMAREVTVGNDGRATGVTFIDKTTGREGHVRGRIVILAAGSAESVRLLLNSASPRFPQGLANSSGLVGKYFMDSVDISVRGQIPLLENLPPHNEDGASGSHVYAPWWLYREQRAGKLPFARGYHVQFYGGRQMPAAHTFNSLEWLTGGSYGRWFKQDARRYYGSFVTLQGLGEMIPNDDCFCELDPEVRDRWGIPVMRFHWKWSEQEMRQAAHMQGTFTEVVSAMGGRVQGRPEPDETKILKLGGCTSHEVGGARMGEDAGSSVTNRWNQAHDVANLFVVDGAAFATSSDKNPTLTIMALAWRAADRIVAEMKRGNL
jgi:choline dehydrogenase-like flavoprotein